MWEKLYNWYEWNKNKPIVKFIEFLLSLFVFVLMSLVIGLICHVGHNIHTWCKWKWCYTSGTCKPVEFINEIYPAKTTREVDNKITSLFDEPFVIFNVNSKIIHNDVNCKYAKECTKSCVYISQSTANKLLESGIAHNCMYEFYTKKHCEDKCKSVSEKLEDYCIDNCIDKSYNDEPFSVFGFLQEMAEENVEEPDYDDYPGE